MVEPDDERGIQPVEHSPVYGIVVEHIRRAIHIGTFVAGDKLPPERELARQINVSRTTVREADTCSRGRRVPGDVPRSDGRSARPRARPGRGAAGPLVRSRLDELEQIIDFRLAVECRAARLAALRRSEEDLERPDERIPHHGGGMGDAALPCG